MFHNFLWEYICKNIQKVALINDYIDFNVFWFGFLYKDNRE